MATYLTINGINTKVIPEIETDYQPKMAELDYVGQNGSNTVGLGNKGRLLDFDIYVKPVDVQKIIALRNSNSTVKVVSKSKANYNGQYQIKKFTSKEHKTKFVFSIQLQEYTKYNVTTKSFTNWKVTSKKTSGTSSTANYTSLYKALLKCPTLKYNSSNTKCVKVLQKLLRLNGFYIKYKGHNLLIDGKFLTYTRWAVKLFQKKYKLKQDGIVGPKTKAKFKGKIGTTTKK
jgi:murein L,D-transpeptidase YcbB/YkuD